MVIARLAPQDYHRFHSPVSGKIGKFVPIDGSYYTVNPVAIRSPLPVYCDNKRCLVEINTKNFDDVLYIAVGATLVGSIHWTVKEGQTVKKGEELGYFSFGGSTVLLFFQKDKKPAFDDDLVKNSEKQIETYIKMGDHINASKK